MNHIKPFRYLNIDLGVIHLGSCVREIGSIQYNNAEQSVLCCTKQGRVYNDFEESTIPEMVFSWVKDRWNYIEALDCVIFEKQVHNGVIQNRYDKTKFSKNKTISNTVLIENSFRCIFMAMPNAPKFVVVTAGWWRNTTNIKGKVTHLMTSDQIYRANKQSSIDAFITRFGKQHYDDLSRTMLDNHCTDFIESYWIGEAVALKLNEIIEASNTVYNHNAKLLPVLQRRIPAKERMGTWKDFPTKESLQTPYKELLIKWKEYRNTLSREKTMKKYTKTQKKLKTS